MKNDSLRKPTSNFHQYVQHLKALKKLSDLCVSFFLKWAKIALIAPPKNDALKFSKSAKNGIIIFSFTRRIF